ncbi:hypothetical protein PS918_00676 [Pseudomonas fluorescens]|uniref:LRAT domain-containing protein n=1 Tax=Pseudomonas fluorescens TaxID=294 RepID=A0A5E7R179_PSEFL|nr:lecithin retinol acyltransferase family protein [Pseudomonas fluorescens]VVP68061.1 hypothetical protein PS918_00676 [Pseudomonas fluorescens]
MKSLMAHFIEGAVLLRQAARVVAASMMTAAGCCSDVRLFHCDWLALPRIGSGLAESWKNSLSPLAVDQALMRLPVGSHLISPRRFYIHHGIHLGGGRVAHYCGYSGSFRPGPVEVTDLESFANGRPVWIVQEPCNYSNDEIVNRAYSRVGENSYKILSNNCEHFCSWCTRGKSYSVQVDALLHSPRHFFSMIRALKTCFIA